MSSQKIALARLGEANMELVQVNSLNDNDNQLDQLSGSLIDQASQRIKFRKLEVKNLKARLIQIKVEKSKFIEGFETAQKVKIARLEELAKLKMEEIQKESALEVKALALTIEQRKSELLAVFNQQRQVLQEQKNAPVQSMSIEEKDYSKLWEQSIDKDDFKNKLVIAALSSRNAMISEMVSENKSMLVAELIQQIWLKFWYPVIADEYERANGFNFSNYGLREESFLKVYSRYYISLIQPVLDFFTVADHPDQLTLMSSIVPVFNEFNGKNSSIYKLSLEVLYRRREDIRISNNTTNLESDFSLNIPNNKFAKRIFGLGSDLNLKKFALFMVFLNYNGLSENFNVSQFAEAIRRCFKQHNCLRYDKLNKRGDCSDDDLMPLVDGFLNDELLRVSGFDKFLGVLSTETVTLDKAGIQKIFDLMLGKLLSNRCVEKDNLEKKILEIDGVIAEIEKHAEIVALKSKQNEVKNAAWGNEEYRNLQNKLKEEKKRTVKEDAQFLALDQEEFEIEKFLENNDTVELKNFLIGANLDRMPLLLSELNVLLLKREYGKKLREVLDQKKEGSVNSQGQRNKKRADHLNDVFWNDLSSLFKKNMYDLVGNARSVAKLKMSFKKTQAPWWYRIKGFLGGDTTTIESLYNGTEVNSDVESYIALNEWIFKLFSVGKVMTESTELKSKELGELYLEMARILREKYLSLPENIEAKLAISDIDMSALTDTLLALPSILQKSGQNKLLQAVSDTYEILDEVETAADPLVNFEKRLAAGPRK